MDSWKKPKQPQQPVIHNSMRMDAAKLSDLFEELDRKASGSQKDPRRSFVRWQFRQTAIPLKLVHVGGSTSTVFVACRNISSGGMSVLHSTFLHTGTKCIATLPHVSGHTIDVEGTVVRCSHVQGTCHELGIKFKNTVDARNFVKLNPFEDGFALENVSPETLQGTILYIEDSVLDQSLVRHFLRETKLRLRIASTLEEAKQILSEGVDLILCDYKVGQDSGGDFVAKIRAEGCTTPAIMITADTSEATRQKLITAEANAFLSKPVSQNLLLRALAEFMTGDTGVGRSISALPASHPNFPMLEKFVREVQVLADMLEKASAANDVDRARSVALQVAGVAPIMGFPQLAQIAQNAERALIATMSVEESKPQLRQLITACREVKAQRAA